MKTSEKIRIGGHQFAHPHKIVKLVANENYTIILFTGGEKLMVATTLGKLEERLEPYGFCRPNRQTVVNLKYVIKVVENSTSCHLTMRNKENLVISKRRIRYIRDTLKEITLAS